MIRLLSFFLLAFEGANSVAPRCLEAPTFSGAGACFAIIPKYIFNAETLCCEYFEYGGCGRDPNSLFETKEECERTCFLPASSGLEGYDSDVSPADPDCTYEGTTPEETTLHRVLKDYLEPEDDWYNL